MKFFALILAAVFFASPAFAAADDTQRKKAIAKIKRVTGYDPEYQNCGSDSDCGGDMICVGLGFCVPKKKVEQFSSKLPVLLKPRQ